MSTSSPAPAKTPAQQPVSVDVVARTTEGIAGHPLSFPAGRCELEAHVVELAPGASVGRHRHPTPCVMYVLEGTIVAALDDGSRKTYRAGEAFVEDAGTWVDNVNPDHAPARFLAVVAGDAGDPKIDFGG